MIAKLVKSSRINRWQATVVATVVGALLVGAGGWAAAGFVGRDRAHGIDLGAVALHAAAGTASRISTKPAQASDGQPAGSSGSAVAAPHPNGSQVTNKLPLGLVALSPQVALAANLRANSAPSANQSATGGGSTQFFHLGFTAQPHRNGTVGGTVSGNAQFSFLPPNPGELHVQVNCLQVVGADAYASGTLMKPVFGIPAGSVILFGVQDGDSASKADLISDIFFTSASTVSCQTFHPIPHYAVQGNTEIH